MDVSRELGRMGLACDTAMRPYVDAWWATYTATSSFYTGSRTVTNRRGQTVRIDYHRRTIHPARRVCVEWASKLVSEGFSAHVEQLDAWMRKVRLTRELQGLVELAFATGTGAVVLTFDGSDVDIDTYDARQIMPISWTRDECDECAMVSRIHVGADVYDQLRAYVLRDGTYHVLTRIVDAGGGEAHIDGVIADYDTGMASPPFVLVRPAIINVRRPDSCMGQSVFADASGAIETVDAAFDSISREIEATKIKTFMSESLFDSYRTEDGVTIRPMSFDDEILQQVSPAGDMDLIKQFAPPIRIEPLRAALDVALAELGDLTGFGSAYFKLDKAGGLRTATEVASDNAQLMGTLSKHQALLGDAVSRLLVAAGEAQGMSVEPSVTFADSIITDDEARRQQLLAEVGAGIIPPWYYLAQTRGLPEDEARALADEAQLTGSTLGM